ncbi:MAG: hypothetical protein AAFQ82_27835, partial [Myxococcota bacterium]
PLNNPVDRIHGIFFAPSNDPRFIEGNLIVTSDGLRDAVVFSGPTDMRFNTIIGPPAGGNSAGVRARSQAMSEFAMIANVIADGGSGTFTPVAVFVQSDTGIAIPAFRDAFEEFRENVLNTEGPPVFELRDLTDQFSSLGALLGFLTNGADSDYSPNRFEDPMLCPGSLVPSRSSVAFDFATAQASRTVDLLLTPIPSGAGADSGALENPVADVGECPPVVVSPFD